MYKGKRFFLATISAIVSLPAFAWLASELAAYYEMVSTGMSSRAQLGDDLGFGILLFIVVPPFSLTGAAFVWWVVWFRTGPKKGKQSFGNADA